MLEFEERKLVNLCFFHAKVPKVWDDDGKYERTKAKTKRLIRLSADLRTLVNRQSRPKIYGMCNDRWSFFASVCQRQGRRSEVEEGTMMVSRSDQGNHDTSHTTCRNFI